MKSVAIRIATLLAICMSLAATHAAAQCGGFTASAVTTPVSCNGGANGTATAIPTGGMAPYTYSWSPSGGTAATASGLGVGIYTVTVTDANSCVTTASATITQPAAALNATALAQTNLACRGGSTGAATVAVTGGTAPYSYGWSPTGGTAATATGLTAGTYTVTVTDANGCFDTQSFTLTQPAAALNATAAAQTNNACSGGSQGQATVAVTGGTSPYSYSWAPSGGTAATATGFTNGTKTVTVTDANGCTDTQQFTITSPPPITLNPSSTGVSCNGGANGTATANATGGVGGFTYSWAPSGGTAATATGLVAGTYTVTVTDANNCQRPQAVTVFEPTTLVTNGSQTDVLCNGGATGTATVLGSGGSPPYTYSWSPSGGTAATTTGRSAGTYTVTLTDSNGCWTTRNYTIAQPPAVAATTSQVNPTCNGPGNGEVSVTPFGGVGGYTYFWSPSGATTQSVSNVGAGTHSAQITDANGCTAVRNLTLPPAAGTPLVVTTNLTHATAPGACNGTATAPASGGNGPHVWSWAPSGGSAQTATGLCPGTYTPTVTGGACTNNGPSVVIGEPPAAPTLGAVTASPGQVSVGFTPGSTGNLPIDFYRANCGGTTADAMTSPIIVAGLPGTPVTCTVFAQNAAGPSALSATSGMVIPASTPGAPTIGTATAGNAQATVTFTAPGSNGGSAITSYTATSSPTGIAASCAAPCTSITVPGLANGTAYTFTVVAINGVGAGGASGASNSVTPRTVPGAPTIGAATAGNAQASVTFTPPATNGGSAITSYIATSAPPGATGTCTAPCTSITVSGLTNGTAYTFTVAAINVAGTGAASAASNSVTPRTLPGAPIIGTATPGNTQATVTFTAPASDGGSAITSYTATSSPSAITATCGAPCTSITMPGLVNGTAYTFTITATNAQGTGLASAASNSVTPRTVPGAPTIGGATAGSGQATVSFTAPASTGGSPITGYTASCMPGPITATGTASPIIVTGLVNGTPYQCSVSATNAAGTGPASATTPIAPALSNYSGPSATGTGLITASFTGGGAGCTFAAPQFIAPPPGAAPVPSTAPENVNFVHGLFDFRTTGCAAGGTLTFTIVYPAALPAGTQYWKYGPTPSNAAPHWYTLPATITGNTAAFTIVDGGLGDDDLAANGTIVDQGGPGVPGAPGTPSAIPTLTEWMLIVLALLMFEMTRRGIARGRRR